MTVRRVMPSRKQSASGVWMTPSLTKKMLAPRAFSHAAAVVEHQRVGETRTLGTVLLDGADHVEAGGLGLGRRGGGIRAAIFGKADADALQALFHGEVRAPIPGGDGEVDLRLLSRNAHLLAAAPGDRADVAIDELVGGHDIAAGLIDLGHALRDLEFEDAGALDRDARCAR